MDPYTPKKITVEKYDIYFKDDVERYMQGYESNEQFLAMTNQEAGGSGSGIKRTRTYIPREREEAEQRLLEDYFGDDETPPKYLKENFRQRYRMSFTLFAQMVNNITSYDAQPLPEYFRFIRNGHDATGRGSIGAILKCTSAIRQLAYDTAPDAFDEYLKIAERCSRESPFVVNERTYKQGYYLADGFYPTWSTLVKTFTIARNEKTLRFKRVQESARKDIERAFGVLQGNFELSNFKGICVNPEPNIQRTWIERCDVHVRKTKEL
uniref:Protein ALP1-like n=1 Tax=Tanacetum cinerariifolium TaxID=118510 RepID=A0A6L2NLA5_TANCI|nr:hypothetical protein [Tanacetum cinerariifolium]